MGVEDLLNQAEAIISDRDIGAALSLLERTREDISKPEETDMFTERAMHLYDSIIRDHPDEPDALHGRGWINYMKGRPRKAISDFAAAIKLIPPGKKKGKELLFSDQYEKLAGYHLSKGLVHKQMSHLNKALEELQTAESLYGLCHVQAFSREMSKIGETLDDKSLPEDCRLSEAASDLFGWDGRTSVCERTAENTKDIDKKHSLVYLQIADILVMQGNTEEAIEYLKNAIMHNSKNPLNHSYLGNLYLSLAEGRAIDDNTLKKYFKPALMSFTRAHLNEPDNYIHLINRGIVFGIVGLHKESFEDLEKARQIDPQNPEPYAALGLTLLKTGHPDSARIMYENVLELAKQRNNPVDQRCADYARTGLEKIKQAVVKH